jgi:hypothetical protein
MFLVILASADCGHSDKDCSRDYNGWQVLFCRGWYRLWGWAEDKEWSRD